MPVAGGLFWYSLVVKIEQVVDSVQHIQISQNCQPMSIASFSSRRTCKIKIDVCYQ